MRRDKGRSKRRRRGLKGKCDGFEVLEGVEGGETVLAMVWLSLMVLEVT